MMQRYKRRIFMIAADLDGYQESPEMFQTFGFTHRLTRRARAWFAQPDSGPQVRRVLIALWVVLVLLKVAYALTFSAPPAINDEKIYLQLARNMVAGNGYALIPGQRTACVMPGFPSFLAFSLWVDGGRLAAIYVFQAILTLVIAFACGRLTVFLTGKRRLGILTAFIVFLLPPYIAYTRMLMTEILYTTLLMLSLLYWEELRQNPGHLRYWGLTGLFHVLGFMTRPVTFLLTPAILGWPLLSERLRPRAILGAAIGSLIVLAVWTPWVVRNYQMNHTFLPLTPASGYAFFNGTLNDKYLTEGKEVEEENRVLKASGLLDRPHTQAELTDYMGKAARANIRRDPLGYVQRIVMRSWRFWVGEYTSYFFHSRTRLREYLKQGRYFAFFGKLSLPYFNWMLALCLAGSFLVLWRKVRFWPYMMLILYFQVVHALTLPIARYSVPLHGLAVVLIVCAATEVARRWWKRERANGRPETGA